MNFLKKASIAAGIALCLALPVSAQQGDPRPGYGEIFAPDRLAGLLANFAIAAARTQVELEYQHLSTDILRGTLSISGVTIRPNLAYDNARQCEITIERAVIGGSASEALWTASEADINLVGASAGIACLPPEIGLSLRSAGFNDITLDRLSLSQRYVYTTGAIRSDLSAAINGIAMLDVSAEGMLLARPDPFGGPGDPAVRVTHAVATLSDTGGWAAFSQLLPENLRAPEAVRGLATEQLTLAMTEGGGRTLSAVEQNFLDGLMTQLESFVRDPGELTIEANLPAGAVVVEPALYEKPANLITALALEARTAPMQRAELLDTDLLARIGSGALEPAERLEIAGALMSGQGVPMATALVPDVLAPVLDGGDAPDAAALMARALAPTDPSAAYPFALEAAAGGVPGALSVLDALEARMTTMDVVGAQEVYAAATGTADPVDAIGDIDDPRDLRALALAHFTGLDAPRDYPRAYFFALLAEAGGDIGATLLREEIDSRFTARGPEVAGFWADISATVQAAALSSWIDLDLATRFRAN